MTGLLLSTTGTTALLCTSDSLYRSALWVARPASSKPGHIPMARSHRMCMLLSFQRPPRLAGGDSSGALRSPGAQWPERAVESSAPFAGGHPPRLGALGPVPRRSNVAGSPRPQGVRRKFSRSGDPQAPELALAELQHAAVQRRWRARRAAPPAPARRRASRRPGPACGAPRSASRRRPRRSPRAGAASRRWRDEHELLDLVRQLVRDEDAVEAGLGLGRGVLAPEALHERAREGALGVARAHVRPAAARPEQQPVPGRELVSGIRSVLPYMSPGGSVIPMWLP